MSVFLLEMLSTSTSAQSLPTSGLSYQQTICSEVGADLPVGVQVFPGFCSYKTFFLGG